MKTNYFVHNGLYVSDLIESLILALMMSLSLQAVMTCNLLYFPLIFQLEMASKTCWTVVGSFLPTLRIQTLVLFLADK